MCFSAPASFAAATVLGTTGIFTLTRIKGTRQLPFAAIPLMFTVQQVAEGFLWLETSDLGFAAWKHPSVYTFLFFAQVIWPLWVPFAVWMMEKDPVRKKILSVLVGAGLLISSYLLYSMLAYEPSAHLSSGHIHYSLQFPFGHAWIRHVLYTMATVLPLFVSSVKKMSVLGIAVSVSYIFAKGFFENYVISVWCFFAAIMSFIVLGIIYVKNRERGNGNAVGNIR